MDFNRSLTDRNIRNIVSNQSSPLRIALVSLKVNWVDAYNSENTIIENFGLGQLSSIAKNAWAKVLLIDADLLGIDDDKLLNQIRDFNSHIVGFSEVSSTVNRALCLCEKLRRQNHNIFFAFGDVAATIDYKSLIKYLPERAAIFIGEADYSFRDFLNGKTLDKISGLIFKDNSKIFNTGQPEPVTNLNTLPLISRDTLLELDCNDNTTLSLLTSRGCPGSCQFCSRPIFASISGCNIWRVRSTYNIVSEISELMDRFSVSSFYFFDDNFAGPIEGSASRLIDFTKEIKKLSKPIVYRFACRCDLVCALDEQVIRLLKKSGLIRVFLGIEAGNDEQLRYYGKGISVQQNERAIRKLEKYGILVHIGFINFWPFSTIKQLEQNSNFLLRTGQSAYFRNFFFTLDIQPNTSIFRRAEKMGLLRQPIALQYNYDFKSKQIEKIYRMVSNIYKKFMCPIDKTLEGIEIQNAIGKSLQKNNLNQSFRNHDGEFLQLRHEIGMFNVKIFNQILLGNYRGIYETCDLASKKFMKKLSNFRKIKSVVGL